MTQHLSDLLLTSPTAHRIPEMNACQDLPESFYPYYVFTASRRFLFFLDSRRTRYTQRLVAPCHFYLYHFNLRQDVCNKIYFISCKIVSFYFHSSFISFLVCLILKAYPCKKISTFCCYGGNVISSANYKIQG